MMRRGPKYLLGRTTTVSSSSVTGGRTPHGISSSKKTNTAQQQQPNKKIWSPLGARASSSPKSVISGSEMLAMFYRKLPPEQTVEAEEDMGFNLVLHREFTSKRAAREGLPWDINPQAKSSVERRVGRARIAQGVNEMRRDAARARSSGSSHEVSLEVSSDIQDAPGALRSVGYVFDAPRVKFCERFVRRYPELEPMVALMEAAAIIYGCTREDGREAWFNYFLGLDRASLDELAERRANNATTMVSSSATSSKTQQEHADDDDEDQSDMLMLTMGEDDEGEEGNDEDDDDVCEIPDEFADVFASYKAYCSGKSPTFGNAEQVLRNADLSDGVVLRKHRWRQLLERLAAEEDVPQALLVAPSSSSDEEETSSTAYDYPRQSVAAELNDQLRTLKLMDLRVGEAVKEALQLQERAAGSGITLRNDPVKMSATHPDRPVQS